MSGVRYSLIRVGRFCLFSFNWKMLGMFFAVAYPAVSCRTMAEAGQERVVEVTHPALSGNKAFPVRLIQKTDPSGCPLEYYADVDSVSCGDGVCDIIKVRMFWDALGGYLRYELPFGGNLTKQKHAAFTDRDHGKLHLILSDPDSRLKNFAPETISGPAIREAHDVDAVTKPTPLFYQDSVVKGAVYTCYTLWHWANGDICAKIRALTVREVSDDHLLGFIREGSEKYFLFATAVLAERERFDESVVSAIINRANADRAVFVQAALVYFETALKRGCPELYCGAFLKIFGAGESQKRTLCLRSLGEVEPDAPAGFYDALAGFLPQLGTYFEVHLMLKLLEQRNPGSDKTAMEAVRVLDNDNFLIARRAYWFLKDRQLTDIQSQAIKVFEQRYDGRL